MSVSVVVNGTSYNFPTVSETGWGAAVTSWAQAVSSHLLQKSGGTFTLTADVDFGATYGLKTAYYKSQSTNLASTGIVRLAKTDLICWRDNANASDLELGVDTSDRLTFNGNPIIGSSILTASRALVSDASGVITPSAVTSTELAFLSGALSSVRGISDTATLTNKTIAAGSNTITGLTDTSIAVGAAIARSKVAAGSVSHVVINDGSGNLSSEAALSASRGGLGLDYSGATGLVKFTAGTSSAATLVNADVSASAAIARTKIASGTNYRILANSSSGVMSENAALTSGNVVIADANGQLAGETSLAITRGGTGQATAAAGFDALSPTTTKGDIAVRTSSSNVRLPLGTDGQVIVADSAQTSGVKWTTLQQGAKNYITYNNFENNANTGWSLFNTGLTNAIPTGTVLAGAGSITTFATTATNPLAGTYSLQTASSGIWAAGAGFISDNFTIDREDRAKVLQVSGFYEVTSGAANAVWSGTSSNTFQVYVYDNANSVWIQPAGASNLAQSSGQGKFTATFQTPSNATTVRIAIIATVATAGAITINWDDFSCGPQQANVGTPVTDWQSYTLTIGGGPAPSQGAGATKAAYWRRIGDSMEIRFEYTQSAAGSSGTGTYTFPLPSGYSIDSTKVNSAPNNLAQNLGSASAYDGTYIYSGTMQYQSSTALYMYASGVGGANTTNTGGQIGSTLIALSGTNVRYGFYAKVPISGWSSSTLISSDTDTRVVSARLSGATTPIGGTGTYAPVQFTTASNDTHGAATTGATAKITAPVAGYYDVYTQIQWPTGGISSGITGLAIYKGGSAQTEVDVRQVALGGFTTMQGGDVVYLNAGEYVQTYVKQSTGSSVSLNSAYLTATRRSGPSAIAASESVYTTSAGATATVTSSDSDVTWTKVDDTHGAMGAISFTAPVAGFYQVDAALRLTAATIAADQTFGISVYKNGATLVASQFVSAGSSTQSKFNPSVSHALKLLAGDTVKINVNSSATTPSVVVTTTNNRLSIKRIGN